MACSAKELEKKFNSILTYYTYASVEDCRTVWEGEDKYPKNKYYDLNNYASAGKKADTTSPLKLTRVVTIGNDVRQLCCELFSRFIGNLRDIEIDDNVSQL